MSVPVFAGWIRSAMTVTRGAAKLTFLFIFNMFVLFAGAGRAVAVAGGITEAAIGHFANQLDLNASDKCNEWNINLSIGSYPFFSSSLTSKIFWKDVCCYEFRCSIRVYFFILTINNR
jgi:hypothetical protein